MERVVKCFRYKEFTNGEIVYKLDNENIISNSMFLIVSGKVGIFQKPVDKNKSLNNPFTNLGKSMNKGNESTKSQPDLLHGLFLGKGNKKNKNGDKFICSTHTSFLNKFDKNLTEQFKIKNDNYNFHRNKHVKYLTKNFNKTKLVQFLKFFIRTKFSRMERGTD